MANWIVTEIEISGKKEILELIQQVINEYNDKPEELENDSTNNWVGNILGDLRINTKIWSARAFWYYAHFNKHEHLIFREHSAWCRSKCAEALKRKFPQEISGINYKYLGWY